MQQHALEQFDCVSNGEIVAERDTTLALLQCSVEAANTAVIQRRVLVTHRLHSSSFWGLPYRIPNMNPKKELYYGAYG